MALVEKSSDSSCGNFEHRCKISCQLIKQQLNHFMWRHKVSGPPDGQTSSSVETINIKVSIQTLIFILSPHKMLKFLMLAESFYRDTSTPSELLEGMWMFKLTDADVKICGEYKCTLFFVSWTFLTHLVREKLSIKLSWAASRATVVRWVWRGGTTSVTLSPLSLTPALHHLSLPWSPRRVVFPDTSTSYSWCLVCFGTCAQLRA